MIREKSVACGRFWGLVFVLFLFVLCARPAIGQTAATGALTGTVTDSTGGVIPNVTVTLTSAEGQVRTTTTGTDGTYRFVLLPPGNYRVKFEASGFNSEEVPAATVDVTETEVLNRALAVGVQSQSVTVEANVETVQTASSALGTVVGSQAIVDLPLSTRNYTDLLSLSAGANAAVNNATVLGQGQQLTAVNGASTAQNNYQVDGMNGTLYAGFNTLAEGGGNSGEPPIPNPDALQEFKIQTSTYDASYGRNSGANVNVVTKSGTNDFHGTAFEFFRNTVLNANDWFLKRSELSQGLANTEGALNQNQYGGVIGGPVKKDKLFFFISYQQTYQKNGFASQGFVSGIKFAPIPNLAGGRGTCPAPVTTIAQMESQCDAATQAFVSALGASVCPVSAGGANNNSQDRPFHNTYNATLTTRLTGVDVNCNGNNISPQAIQTLQLKLPNGQYYVPSSCAAGATCNTYTPNPLAFTDPAIYNEYQGVGNFDYLINSKNTLSGRYFFLTNPFTAPFGTTSQLEGTPQTSEFGNQFAILKLTSVISTNLVNEARMGYNRHTEAISLLPLRYTAPQVGMTALSCNPPGTVVYASLAPGACGPYPALPTTTITGLFTYGPFYQGVHNITENTPSASDQLSWTHGKHTIRTGFEYTHVHYVWLQRSYQFGNYTFDTFADFLLGLPGCAVVNAACTNGAAAAQAGGAGIVPASYSNPGTATNGTLFSNIDNIGATSNRTDPTGLIHYFYTTNLNAFVQDDFKINSKLTLNIGLRWEYDQTVADQKGDGVNIWARLINLQPIPGSGCVFNGVTLGSPGAAQNVNGCSFAGYTAPSNYSVARRGPLPAGVFQSNSKFPTAGPPPWDNFAPRLGFAWQPLSRKNGLVVRGGFGYFYDLIPGGQLAPPINQEPPYEENVNLSTAQNFGSSAVQPFLTAPLGWGGGARFLNFTNGVGSSLNPAGTQGAITPNLVTPLTYNYNLQVQYEFLPSWVMELGYVGSLGIHQEIPDPINPSPLASASHPLSCGFDGVATDCITGNTASGGVTQTSPGVFSGGPADRSPYLGFAPNFHVAASTGNYKFNSVQMTVRKSFSHGLLFQAAYTWSRAFVSTYVGNPNASFSDNVPVIEIYGQNPSYRPQSLHLNYSWVLPLGHHEGLMNKVASGWTVSGVTTIQDGTPLTITDNRLGSVFGTPGTPVVSPALYAPGATRATQATSGSIQDRVNAFINPAAFCAPTASAANPCFGVTTQPAGAGLGFGYGASGLGTILGPGQNNWDISLFKTTQVGGLRENAVLQFRAEFFNAFNHPQFNNPINTTGQVAFNNLSTFGQINSMSVNPRFVQFALKYIF